MRVVFESFSGERVEIEHAMEAGTSTTFQSGRDDPILRFTTQPDGSLLVQQLALVEVRRDGPNRRTGR